MGRLSKVEISGVNTSKLPVLTREEAKALFLEARQGSEEARQKLIQGNLRLVLSVIKKFDGRKPKTTCRITHEGQDAFAQYVEALKSYMKI